MLEAPREIADDAGELTVDREALAAGRCSVMGLVEQEQALGTEGPKSPL